MQITDHFLFLQQCFAKTSLSRLASRQKLLMPSVQIKMQVYKMCGLVSYTVSFFARYTKKNSIEIAIYTSIVQTEIVLHIQNPFSHFIMSSLILIYPIKNVTDAIKDAHPFPKHHGFDVSAVQVF